KIVLNCLLLFRSIFLLVRIACPLELSTSTSIPANCAVQHQETMPLPSAPASLPPRPSPAIRGGVGSGQEVCRPKMRRRKRIRRAREAQAQAQAQAEAQLQEEDDEEVEEEGTEREVPVAAWRVIQLFL
ncbi:hypothetical protein V8C35DRAFT_116490, partial [Trichoderma chlorosporum]